MSLLRADISNVEWLENFVPLRYDLKMSGGGFSEISVSKMPNFIESFSEPTCVFLYGEAGIGKSTTLSYLCSEWNKGHVWSDRFAHAYLITVRSITNHTAPLEYIICHDLKLVPPEHEQSIRRFIKFNGRSVIFFVDGYDEKTDHGFNEITINKLISRKCSPNSTVVVSSRPHMAADLEAIRKTNTWEIHVRGFDDIGVKRYLNHLPQEWAPSYHDLMMNSSITQELLKSPLILAMRCYVHQKYYDRTGERSSLHLVSTCSVLDAVCGILLGIMEEKKTGRHLQHYTSYRDERLGRKMRGITKALSKLAFHATQMNKFDFDVEELNENHIYDEDIANIGILRLGIHNSKYSFIHPLFQEHAAAYHMADNAGDLNRVLSLLQKPGLTTTKLNNFSNPLLFAVGLDESVVDKIGATDVNLPVVKVACETNAMTKYTNLDFELSYHSRLLQECNDSVTKEAYLQKIKHYLLPSEPDSLTYEPQIEASAYIYVIDALGKDGCISLLQRVHTDDMRIEEDRVTLSPPEGGNTRVISDTLLISCLPVIDITHTDRLIIQHGSLRALTHTTNKWKVKNCFSSTLNFEINLIFIRNNLS